jgi:hypothetical protein
MAEGWGSESSLNSRSESPWRVDVTYLSDLYETSLLICNEFIDEFCQHVRILYGSSLAERLQSLGIDERNKRLIGLLLQLGNADLLPTLDGVSAFRLMDVDFVNLLSCTELSCDEAIGLCIGSDGLDLGEVCLSTQFIYEGSFGCDFQNLVTCLVRTGKYLAEALSGILTNDYGLYYEWRQTVVILEAELAERDLPRADMWNLDRTSTDDNDREVSICFCFQLLSLGVCY